MSGFKSRPYPIAPEIWAHFQLLAKEVDRSNDPCERCGRPSGRTFFPKKTDRKLFCSECLARMLDAAKAYRRDERLAKEAP